MAIFSNLGKFKDTGLLIIRLGLGAMFILHGYPKLMGGPEKWEKVGNAISHIGIDAFPTAWGFAAGLTEVLGGLFFALGLFFRPTSLALAFTMLIAALSHLSKGTGIMSAAHAIEIGLVFVGLSLVGPGKISVDKR